jgi:predicted Na+-dependent transporter
MPDRVTYALVKYNPQKELNMTLNDFLSTIAGISGLLFVVTSMLAMGMSLTIAQILQPLKNARLVILALTRTWSGIPKMCRCRGC